MRSFIQSIPQLFYGSAFYADLILRSKGIGMRFILLQVFLACVIPASLLLFPAPDLQQKVVDVFNRMPDITIKDQKLSIDRPSPYSIEVKEGEDASASIVFDTAPLAADSTEIERKMHAQNAMALVTSDFIAVLSGATVNVYSFHNFGQSLGQSTVITHEDWVKLGKKSFSTIVGVIVLFTFASILATVFIASFVVRLLSLFFTVRPELPAAIRLSAAAAIPFALFDFLLKVTVLLTHQLPSYTLPPGSGAIVWLAFVVYGLASANKEVAPPDANA